MPIVVDTDLLAQEVTLRRGLEGPQLVLTWKAPLDSASVDRIVVVRKKYEFAELPTAGGGQTIVFDGPPGDGSVTDIAPDIEPCRCYYYTVFSVKADGEEHHDPSTQAADFAIETGFFAKKLFELLPDLYVVGDKRLEKEEPGKLALQKTFDTASKEFFNLLEDGVIERGQLQRFLRTVAVELDIVKGLIDCLPVIWDVDEACCRFLEPLAALIGLNINKEFPCNVQREEIRQHVAILKIKGTKLGVEARARLISRLTVRSQECLTNILISNMLDRTTMKSPNPGLGAIYKLPGDDTDFTPGGDIGFNCFRIFFMLDCDDCLSDAIVKKLERELPKEWPMCRSGQLVFVDCVFTDEYDTDQIQELVSDIIEDAVVVEDFRTHCWLITNRLTDTVFPPPIGPSLLLGRERHYTNSLAARTPAPGPCVDDSFFDLVECVCRINRGRINCSRIGECADVELLCPPRVDEARVDCSGVE